jgi:hypothetical protein
MAPVALAMKSIAPLSLPMVAPAAGCCGDGALLDRGM